MTKNYSLPEMGWKPFFQQQLTLEDYDGKQVARVVAVHRDRLDVLTEQGLKDIQLNPYWLSLEIIERPTVGDWLVLNEQSSVPDRLLERMSLIQRISAGSEAKSQLIAANLDTLFIVSSCNQDFNTARIERYLALALGAAIQPVILLTKADMSEDPESYLQQAQSIRTEIPVVCVNALSAADMLQLDFWLRPGATVAFVGSSGVGKSTLTNTLLQQQVQSTRGIREDDAKGKHTTTSRNMVRLQSGTWVMDTPGMRELKLGEEQDGVKQLFDDIELLATQCKFGNCQHNGDVGCAIENAIANGDIDGKRLNRYLKLMRETQHATMTQAEHRQKGKAFGKMAKNAQRDKQAANNNYKP